MPKDGYYLDGTPVGQPAPEPCRTCGGRGIVAATPGIGADGTDPCPDCAPAPEATCPTCRGEKRVHIPCPEGRRGCGVLHLKPCPHCIAPPEAVEPECHCAEVGTDTLYMDNGRTWTPEEILAACPVHGAAGYHTMRPAVSLFERTGWEDVVGDAESSAIDMQSLVQRYYAQHQWESPNNEHCPCDICREAENQLRKAEAIEAAGPEPDAVRHRILEMAQRPEVQEAARQGFADLDAGRYSTLEKVKARLEVADPHRMPEPDAEPDVEPEDDADTLAFLTWIELGEHLNAFRSQHQALQQERDGLAALLRQAYPYVSLVASDEDHPAAERVRQLIQATGILEQEAKSDV